LGTARTTPDTRTSGFLGVDVDEVITAQITEQPQEAAAEEPYAQSLPAPPGILVLYYAAMIVQITVPLYTTLTEEERVVFQLFITTVSAYALNEICRHKKPD
jgi:hypothetical protein